MGPGDKIRTVESRDEMEGQMLVNRVWKTRRRMSVPWFDVS